MSNVRFQIGIPRAGSAARISEEEGWRPSSIKPVAGSAARDAEERKRAEGSMPKRATAVAMRASGGVPFRVDEQGVPIPDASTMKEPRISSEITGADRITNSYKVSSDAVAPLATSLERNSSTKDPVRPGALQSAAARIQSLTRSLFFRDDGNR